MTNLRLSPLDGAHRALGAKMVEFGGWDMPVAYATGTISEHLACRSDAVVFDVSHLGTVRVEGFYAKAALQDVLTNDLDKISVGRAQYTHLLNDSGCVLDDIIVWWVRDDRFDVMPNASNTDHVLSAIGGVDITATRAVLAVQGPRAKSLLSAISEDFSNVAKFQVRRTNWRGAECVSQARVIQVNKELKLPYRFLMQSNYGMRFSVLALFLQVLALATHCDLRLGCHFMDMNFHPLSIHWKQV